MPRLTKAERELAKVKIAMLSFKRYSESEIVKQLAEERPPIMLSKSRVHQIKTGLEKKADSWYTRLRDTTYQYKATYKDAIDSLYRYQNMLHKLYNQEGQDKLAIIRELHHIELSIKNIYKELPTIGTSTDVAAATNTEQQQQTTETPELE